MRQICRGKADGRESALRVDDSGAVSVWIRCSDGAFHELRDSPYQKAAALVELLRDTDTRDQSRLARCAAESRRLSLEECCYWLVLVKALRPAEAVAMRDVVELSRARWQFLRMTIDDMRDTLRVRPAARRTMTIAWLCREALRRIEEERR